MRRVCCSWLAPAMILAGLAILPGWRAPQPRRSSFDSVARAFEPQTAGVGKEALAPGDSVQLEYVTLPQRAATAPDNPARLPREIPGRRIPELTPFEELDSPQPLRRVVPLPEANTLAHVSFQQGRFGQLRTAAGEVLIFNPEVALVKLRDQAQVGVVRVEPGCEWQAVRTLARRSDVQFAELDVFHKRQFAPDDPLIGNQWHHQVIGSYQAWDRGLGAPFVRLAIVDAPFQMDHPDLAANTVSGWDVVANAPVTSATGDFHATMCAGMAAAVIANDLGVAGAVNCDILPVNITGATSEMYNAVVWAADHNVRVVNLSWSGGDSDTVETAAYYLKTHARGILGMAGVNGTGFLNYTNQPDIYCISMTDAADNMVSSHGNHIDFAAPGWQIFSTATGGGYASDSGTSYSTPLFCGVVAAVLSLNPTLGPDDVIGILKSTAVDLGQPGWDQYFGWGRIDYAAAAAAAVATLPNIISVARSTNGVVVAANFRDGVVHSLWRSAALAPSSWSPVTNAILSTNSPVISLTDPSPPPGGSYYRVQAALP